MAGNEMADGYMVSHLRRVRTRAAVGLLLSLGLVVSSLTAVAGASVDGPGGSTTTTTPTDGNGSTTTTTASPGSTSTSSTLLPVGGSSTTTSSTAPGSTTTTASSFGASDADTEPLPPATEGGLVPEEELPPLPPDAPPPIAPPGADDAGRARARCPSCAAPRRP